MMLLSLLYVSRSNIDAAGSEAAVADVVDTAHRNNSIRGLTGALIFAGSNFAQILEGPEDAVETMMASIAADPRHRDILIADRSTIATRRFPRWNMAYFGSVPFVGRHIVDVFEEQTVQGRSRAAKQLAKLIHQFTLA